MSATRYLVLGAVLAAVAGAIVLAIGWRRTGDAPPQSAAFSVPEAPAVVYDAILPEIRDRVARDTKIVRVDEPGGLEMRFTAYLEDHSVRLVEIRLSASGTECVVSVNSRRFSFLPGRRRDTLDATLEASLGALIRRRTAPTADDVTRPPARQ